MTDAEVDALEAGSKIVSKKSRKVREVVMTRKSNGRVMTAELLAIVKTRYGCQTSAVERWSLKNRYERSPDAEKAWVKSYAGGKPNYTTPQETHDDIHKEKNQ